MEQDHVESEARKDRKHEKQVIKMTPKPTSK
jgi:hypothetical protein